jgi:hypothetical protein
MDRSAAACSTFNYVFRRKNVGNRNKPVYWKKGVAAAAALLISSKETMKQGFSFNPTRLNIS